MSKDQKELAVKILYQRINNSIYDSTFNYEGSKGSRPYMMDQFFAQQYNELRGIFRDLTESQYDIYLPPRLNQNKEVELAQYRYCMLGLQAVMQNVFQEILNESVNLDGYPSDYPSEVSPYDLDGPDIEEFVSENEDEIKAILAELKTDDNEDDSDHDPDPEPEPTTLSHNPFDIMDCSNS